MVMANFGHLVAFKKAVLGWHKAENMRRSVLHMLMLWASPRRYCIMLRFCSRLRMDKMDIWFFQEEKNMKNISTKNTKVSA